MPTVSPAGDAANGTHRAFLDALGSMRAGGPRWAPSLVGFQVLRLVDEWARIREGLFGLRPSKITAVRNAIAVLPAGQERGALDEIVTAVTRSRAFVTLPPRTSTRAPGGVPRESLVLPAMVAYGAALEELQEWTLAADVYAAARAVATTPGELALRAQIAVQLGRCLITAGSFEAAAAALGEAQVQAADVSDRYTVLAAEHQIAKLALHRGALDDAEDALLAVVVACDTDGASIPALADILARALHDLGHLALRQEKVDMAFEYLLRALATYRELRSRNRLLHDLAVAFRDLGLHALARRMLQYVVARVADDPLVRVAALLNLMDLAVREGSEPLFQRYRMKLRAESLAPRMDVDYQITIGEGLRRFGHAEKAAHAFNRAERLAERHGLLDHRRQIAAARTAPVCTDVLNAPDVATFGPATNRTIAAMEELCAEVAGIAL
jgi:tetratricopeptide (TPR) repeat protein